MINLDRIYMIIERKICFATFETVDDAVSFKSKNDRKTFSRKYRDVIDIFFYRTIFLDLYIN